MLLDLKLLPFILKGTTSSTCLPNYMAIHPIVEEKCHLFLGIMDMYMPKFIVINQIVVGIFQSVVDWLTNIAMKLHILSFPDLLCDILSWTFPVKPQNEKKCWRKSFNSKYEFYWHSFKLRLRPFQNNDAWGEPHRKRCWDTVPTSLLTVASTDHNAVQPQHV